MNKFIIYFSFFLIELFSYNLFASQSNENYEIKFDENYMDHCQLNDSTIISYSIMDNGNTYNVTIKTVCDGITNLISFNEKIGKNGLVIYCHEHENLQYIWHNEEIIDKEIICDYKNFGFVD